MDKSNHLASAIAAFLFVQPCLCTATKFQSQVSNFLKQNANDRTDEFIRDETGNGKRRHGRFENLDGSDKYQNFTAILEKMLNGYDKRLRPNFEEDPVDVYVTLHVSSISAISEVSMDFTIDFYLRQSWRDERLANSTLDHDVTVGIDLLNSIWVPDTFFPNEKRANIHTATTHNSFVRITSNGEIFTSQRLTVTPSCPMVLRKFPFDTQMCTLQIESYGYASDEIRYHWHPGKDALTIGDIWTQQFFLANHTTAMHSISLSTGSYSRLYVFFEFKRDIGYYIMQVYLPCISVVAASLLAFWFPEELLGDRIALCFTAVLTITVLMTTTNSNLPKISYVKAIDIYLITSFLIIFLTLIESCFTAFLSLTEPAKNGDVGSRKLKTQQSLGASIKSHRANRSKSADGASQHPWEFANETNYLSANTAETTEIRIKDAWWRRLLGQSRSYAWRRECCHGWINAGSLDWISRYIFPGFFLLFNIIYWPRFLLD